MFGTSIHWTTFFYLILDIAIVFLTIYLSKKIERESLKRYLTIGFLFIAYNFTGGFLPIKNFPGPFILQYIITYSVAITLCVYILYYLYKEYDIIVLKFKSSILNISLVSGISFLILFLIPYFLTESLHFSRILFTVPIALMILIFSMMFYKRIYNISNPNAYILRRNKLSMISVGAIALLPICTLVGDYQWITFSVMNISFYTITAMEIDRYLFFLQNKNKLYEIFLLKKEKRSKVGNSDIIYENLTRREMEIAISILSDMSYKKIADDLFIAESTVSKHASNIFKKSGVKNRKEFINRFKSK